MNLRVWAAMGAVAAVSGAEPEIDPKELPRIPPTEPASAVKTFKIREGFKMELAASEPNVASPVAISFDEDGRMFVVEMRDYSEHREENLGRIRRLEDLDGDGVFEKSVIFAEQIPWPTAVICYDGGVFVGSSPDILFFKDNEGDGKADERRVIFSGFGQGLERLNVQQLLNSFNWGLDNRIHGANGGNGGRIVQVASGGPAIRMGTDDFSFDPRTLLWRSEIGGGQHGFSFDDFGRKFVSNNSSHIRMAMHEKRYLRGGPVGFTLPNGIIDIAREGPAAEVFRISPEEPWRKVRTRLRVEGQVPGPIEGGGRASGYFTGATGVTIYRGDAYPPEFSNNAFIGDAGGNLVHRKILHPNGVAFEAARPGDELNREFLASTDTWFRPVQFANAPDGCLYVVDMYREVIEHPWSLPPGIKKHLDLNSGRERGRIWRIAPENFKRPKIPQLSRAKTPELVAALDSDNGWRRDTAARLIYQRQDKSAIPALKKLLESPRPQTRVHAMHALAGLGAPEAFLNDKDPNVVERALICYEDLKSKTAPEVSDLSSPRVRHQLAWTVASATNRVPTLAKIISMDATDPWIRIAVAVSSLDYASHLFQTLIANTDFLTRDGAVTFLSQLAPWIKPELMGEALDAAITMPNRAAAYRLAAATYHTNQVSKLKQLVEEAVGNFDKTSTETQIAALILARLEEPARTFPFFTRVYAQQGAEAARLEAYRGLLRNLRDAANLLWNNWPQLPAGLRQKSLDLLMSRAESHAMIIDALKKSRLTRADLTASQSQILRQHPNPAISRPALELLGQVNVDRAAVIEKFRPALQKSGDMKTGERLFTERCATCHRVAGIGQATGPDLESVRGNGREYILIHVLDPNREVNSRFIAYTVELNNGDDPVTGILTTETDSVVTLRLASGEEKAIPRAQIRKLTASAQSLMPAGLEEGLDVDALASLLDYVEKAKR